MDAALNLENVEGVVVPTYLELLAQFNELKEIADKHREEVEAFRGEQLRERNELAALNLEGEQVLKDLKKFEEATVLLKRRGVEIESEKRKFQVKETTVPRTGLSQVGDSSASSSESVEIKDLVNRLRARLSRSTANLFMAN